MLDDFNFSTVALNKWKPEKCEYNFLNEKNFGFFSLINFYVKFNFLHLFKLFFTAFNFMVQ